MDNPSTIAMLAALVDRQFITQENKAELLALGDATQSWAEHVGLGVVGIGAVRNARKVIASEVSSGQ
jgi:hypothetical protein